MAEKKSPPKKRKSWLEEVMKARMEENAKKSSFDVSIEFGRDGGDFFGLPNEVKQIFKENRKVETLYEWQTRCLKQPCIENGRNLIISLPTGGGKTLVAEIIVLKQILCRNKDALFILPFVSIVQEKIKSFLPFGLECNFLVEEYAANKGRIPPIKRRNKKSVYIATIEKAHSLINSLIECKSLNTVGLIVIDELHMIGDGSSRGSCLEQIISKVQYVSKTTQLIGISATLSNEKDLQDFMHADLFIDNFRPVSLTEYVKIGPDLFKVSADIRRSDTEKIPLARTDVLKFFRRLNVQTERQNDCDHLSDLVLEIVPQDSCLIFCPSKKNCENVAVLLSQILPKMLKQHCTEEKKNLLKALWNECDSNMCNIQRSCIPYGVAYHHSGLTADERKLIQDAFSEGTLCVLCCTSTLAAGVNLPAKRVILRSPMIGRNFLSKQQYKQMSGRAGRAGLDISGESILIVQPNQTQMVVGMLCNEYDECSSSLLYQNGCGLKSALLNVIGLEIVKTKSSLFDFLRGTLLWHQLSEKDTQKLVQSVESALRYLVSNDLIELNKKNDENLHKNDVGIFVTTLGQATLKGCINIDDAKKIFFDLKSALRSLVLTTRLHLLYCVIPYDHVTEVSPDWTVFYNEFKSTTSEEQNLFDMLGVSEDFLFMKTMGSAKAKGYPPNYADFRQERDPPSTVDSSFKLFAICLGIILIEMSAELMLSSAEFNGTSFAVPVRLAPHVATLNRLYLALALRRLWQHETVWKVAQGFQLSRGYVQNLLQSCATFASCLSRFCEHMDELWALQCLLPSFSKQLAYCVSAELIPLMEIQGVKQGRARQLFSAGFKNIKDIASADVDFLIRQIDHLSKRQAREIISGAKMILREEYEHIMEQAEEIMDINANANVSVDDIVASLRPIN